MMWVPTAKALVVNWAVPPDSAIVPSNVVPSVKATLPAGVPTLALTVAVNVTGLPKVLGKLPEVMTKVVVASLFTVCVYAADVLAA